MEEDVINYLKELDMEDLLSTIMRSIQDDIKNDVSVFDTKHGTYDADHKALYLFCIMNGGKV